VENNNGKIKSNNSNKGDKAMITGKYQEDVAMVAEKLMIAFSVEFVKSAPNTKRWEEAIQKSFEIAKTIVIKEYEFLNIPKQ
jgi:hypothetical protein